VPQKRKLLTDADTIETATDRKRRSAINFNLNVECCVAYLQAQENAFPYKCGCFLPEGKPVVLGLAISSVYIYRQESN